ncbi:MAG: phosphoribosylformylglycinamidine cyclo-ligase [Thermodesulfovibrionales bacterium]
MVSGAPERYREAGVDIAEGERFVKLISPLVKRTFRPEVLTGIGSFSALFRLDLSKYKEPVLVSGTDGVGTKLRVAFLAGRHDTVGIDLVAMCVNDILTSGAEPLFFLDYFATGKLRPEDAAKVVEGMVRGCEEAGCSLIGGETAEMPGFYAEGEYDLSGFAVGVVDRGAIIDGSGIAEGDVLIGLASNGLHSNGYSLVRKVFLEDGKMDLGSRVPELGGTLGDELLRPTRIYVRAFKALEGKVRVKGMAHITGGGITGNLPRILPDGVAAALRLGSWPEPPVFGLLKKMGGVSDNEMRATFNMGVGFVVVVERGSERAAMEILARNLFDSFIIGSIVKGSGGVTYE